MFSELSRYNDLDDVIAPDAKGRLLKSRGIRPAPDVSGDFSHNIEEKDRLDHLAYTYYKESRKWWRVCDANPNFDSPPALLGKEPIITTRFPVTYTNADETVQPPWYKLVRCLNHMTGVEDVRFHCRAGLVGKVVSHGGRSVEIQAETFDTAFTVIYNRLSVTRAEIAAAIKNEDNGFHVGEPEDVGRLGKDIVIPPDALE